MTLLTQFLKFFGGRDKGSLIRIFSPATLRDVLANGDALLLFNGGEGTLLLVKAGLVLVLR